MTLAVFGANGATGRHFVKHALAAGHSVKGIEPEWPEADDLPDNVERLTADVIEDDLVPIIEGCDAVVSCIGLPLTAMTALNPPPLYTEGTKNYLSAMEKTGVSRIVVISASFVVTRDRGPALFRASSLVLEPIFNQMGKMEQILRASDVEWVAVRPGWLMDGEATKDYQVVADAIAEGTIRTRHADLGHFMLHCATTDDWVRATPAISRAEADEDESAHRLIAEIAH